METKLLIFMFITFASVQISLAQLPKETTTTLPTTVLTGFLALLTSENGPLIGAAILIVALILWFVRKWRKR